MPVEDLTAASIPQLVEVVLALRQGLGPDAFLWFRGHSCGSYKLRPKLMRDNRESEKVFEREARLLTRFRQRSMAYWPEGYPQNDWEHLFAMQHYGLPTRLLDWTENVFVAAFFSLSEANEGHTHEQPCVPELWCVDPVAWNRSVPAFHDYGEAIRVLTTADDELKGYGLDSKGHRPKVPVAVFGAHNSTRIVAQRGTFMVWGAKTDPLEEIATDQPNSKLWRIRLTGARTEMFAALHTLGFSETMVFPELPSLASELSRTEGWR